MPAGPVQDADAADKPILVLLDNIDMQATQIDMQATQLVRRDDCEHSPHFCSIVLVDAPEADL